MRLVKLLVKNCISAVVALVLDVNQAFASTYGSGPYGEGTYNGSSSGGLANTGTKLVLIGFGLSLLLIGVVIYLGKRRHK